MSINFEADINQFDDQHQNLMQNSSRYNSGIDERSPLQKTAGQRDHLLESQPMKLEDLTSSAPKHGKPQGRKTRRNKS